MNDDNSETTQISASTLNPFGFDANSPLNHDNRPQMSGMQFDSQFEVQKSKMRYSSLVGTSLATSASGNVGVGSVSTVTVNLTPALRQNTNLATPFIAIYEGTSGNASFQIFPSWGGSVTANKFLCTAGYDYAMFTSNTTFPGATPYVVSVYNNQGTAGTTSNLYVIVQWKFTANNTGGQL